MEKIKENFKGEALLCPIRNCLDIIGGKWKSPILCILAEGKPIRNGVIKRKLNGITNTMLAQSLKELESDGLVSRIQYNEVPPRVEYSITEKGKTAIPILLSMAKWGKENISDMENTAPNCDECRKMAK